MARYNYTATELVIADDASTTTESAAVALQGGKLSLPAFLALMAEIKSRESVADMIEMSDTGCVILRDGLRQQWGGLRLYPSEWQTVANRIDAVMTYCKDNAAELAKRGAATKAAKQAAKQAAKAAPAPTAAPPAPTAPATSTQPA